MVSIVKNEAVLNVLDAGLRVLAVDAVPVTAVRAFPTVVINQATVSINVHRAVPDSHAEGIVVEEMKRRRWGEEELGRRAKGDAGKVAMSARLRAETEVTVKWIAERLQMGAPGYVNHLLYLRRKTEGE